MPAPNKALARLAEQQRRRDETPLYRDDPVDPDSDDYRCDRCSAPCGTERFDYVHYKGNEIEDELGFCTVACMVEYFADESTDAKIDEAVRDELNSLHDLVCPACKRRAGAELARRGK